MPTNNPSSSISCPQCRQPIRAHLDQVLDQAQDLEAKRKLLNGQFNLVNCSGCGFAGMIGTPIVYHDPDKELLLTYVPVELNMPLEETERVLGSLTRAIISKIPDEKRTGYLLQPKELLSLHGLINCVLEADGITPEMIESQRTKLELIEKLSDADQESVPDLIKQHDSELDYAFFQLLMAVAEQAASAKDKSTEKKYLDLREQVLQHSALGRETHAQLIQLQEASKELEGLGKNLDRGKILQLIISAENDERITALATLARPLLDYEFFIQLTRTLEEADDDQRATLEHVREVALEAVSQADDAAKARSEAAASLIQTLLQADDLQATIKEHLPQLDELFLASLLQNQETAEKAGQEELSGKLKNIRDSVMKALHDSAPPEIRLINELLALESDEEANALIKNRVAELTPDLLKAMESVAEEMKASGRDELGARLAAYRSTAEKEITLAKWR